MPQTSKLFVETKRRYRKRVVPKGYLTRPQAVERLKRADVSVSPATINNMTKDGRLKAFRLPANEHRNLYRIEDIDKLIEPRVIEIPGSGKYDSSTRHGRSSKKETVE